MHNIDLSGKVALVTGGSRGLGRAMALGLADAGADLILASRSLDRCRAVAAEVEQRGRRALAVAAHLGQPDQIDADRKSTRLNSSHVAISYAVFCLKKKKKQETKVERRSRTSV